MTGSRDEGRIAELEARVVRLENLLAGFAAMIAGTGGDLERIAAAIEIRRRQDQAGKPLPIGDAARMKAMRKIAGMLLGGEPVSHSAVMRAMRGIISTAQLHDLIADLVAKGEIRVIRIAGDKGKPGTFYQHART